ncbi:hypothetical protein GAY29_21550 [Azospirillum brasilense]|uniref:hypothetical protein n=1 Tax=Azospirillum brasilense TaxID=192 RepID=UPI001909CDF1|nr:hypothetical protein [Azospirillum brasilense]MBK3735636.1 hypothetical protein [Azospirillum brasilense]
MGGPLKRIDIPDILTQKDWDKKKGAIAKIAGKTGVGDAMKAVDKAHGAIDWKKLSVSMNSPSNATLDDLDSLLDEARAEYKRSVEPLRTQLQKLRDLAEATAKKFKSNKLIPKDSTAHAEKVAKAADQLFVAFNQSSLGDKIVDDYEGMKDAIEKADKVRAKGREILEKYMLSLAKKLKTAKTVSDYQDLWKEDIRGVGTQLPKMPELKAFLKDWRNISSQDGLPETDDDVKGRCKEVMAVLARMDKQMKAMA